MARMRLFVCATVAIIGLVGCQYYHGPVPDDAPPAYKVGFDEGCDSGYSAAGNIYAKFRKDVMRYASDAIYAQGWNDGFAYCKGRWDSLP